MKNNKINLANIIANDIVHFGMDMTMNFNYCVYLDEYVKKFDKESKDFILNHEKEIVDEIAHNENVADLQYDKKEKCFDMVFYINGLLDHVEKMIYTAAENMDKKLEIEDIRDISADIYDDMAFAEKVVEKVTRYGGYNNEV